MTSSIPRLLWKSTLGRHLFKVRWFYYPGTEAPYRTVQPPAPAWKLRTLLGLTAGSPLCLGTAGDGERSAAGTLQTFPSKGQRPGAVKILKPTPTPTPTPSSHPWCHRCTTSSFFFLPFLLRVCVSVCERVYCCPIIRFTDQPSQINLAVHSRPGLLTWLTSLFPLLT